MGVDINDTGHFTTVSGIYFTFDEPTNKFLMSLQVEKGIMQIKFSEVDMLNIAKYMIEVIAKSKELYKDEGI